MNWKRPSPPENTFGVMRSWLMALLPVCLTFKTSAAVPCELSIYGAPCGVGLTYNC